MDKNKVGAGSYPSSIAVDRGILLRQPMSARDHCALRAPTVFWTDEKHIRPKNTVMKRTRIAQGFMQDRESARTVFRPRNIATPHIIH
jgi:hypothetical protein